MNETDLILSSLQQLADTISNTFPNCMEVVVHDLSRPQSSITYIAGNVTDRKIGGPVTDLVVKALYQEGDNINDKYNYKTYSKNGKELKSSTSFIRNSNGEVIAAFCINFDMTSFINALNSLQMLTATFGDKNDHVESFTSSIYETVDSLFDKAVSKIGKQPYLMTKDERIKLIYELKMLGVFQFKDSISHISMRMGVSKYTIYNYLKESKTRESINQI